VSDPRLNGSHLGATRHELYDAAAEELLDGRGPVTAAADPLARPPRIPRAPCHRQEPVSGGTYTLVNLADGRRYPLRVGINTVGRFEENDIVTDVRCVSRRHCAIVVHATGACEVYDMASRNHTLVNHRGIGRRCASRTSALLPGDILSLAGLQFLVAWVGPDGELHEPTSGLESETDYPSEFLRRLESVTEQPLQRTHPPYG
jgi:pSer/pThr/pTyr-binding forkhead associated (FHA) protein